MVGRRLDWRSIIFLLFSIGVVSGCAGKINTVPPVPMIQFQYTGGPSSVGRVEYLLSIYEDGTVVFDGKHRTRVSGETRTQVGREKVQEWLKALLDAGALKLRELPNFAPAPDSDWWRLTVNHADATNTYRFYMWNPRAPLSKARAKIFADLDVWNRWVSGDDFPQLK